MSLHNYGSDEDLTDDFQWLSKLTRNVNQVKYCRDKAEIGKMLI
ncbi:hypothetical protein [Photorhabdus heterorhabditis]